MSRIKDEAIECKTLSKRGSNNINCHEYIELRLTLIAHDNRNCKGNIGKTLFAYNKEDARSTIFSCL